MSLNHNVFGWGGWAVDVSKKKNVFERVYFRYCLSEEPNYRAGTDTWCLVKAGNEVCFLFFFFKLSGKELSFIVKITWVAFMMIMLMDLHFSESWRD